MSEDVERAKAAAARAAVAELTPGLTLALGTGSTAAYAVRAIADRFPEKPFDCVASSQATEELARSLGLRVRELKGGDRFAVMLDGADEVDPGLNLTKGGGGALLREKLLAGLSERLEILVDPSKLVRHLGDKSPIPVEVVPFARPSLERSFAEDGFRVTRRLGADARPFRTDNGNEILDLRPSRPIDDPAATSRWMRARTGVVETGLFVGMATRVLVGRPDGTVQELRRSG